MKKSRNCLAFDFGASSGRLILSRYDGEKIGIEEIYRFPNEPVTLGKSYHWDFIRLFHELKTGLKKAAALNIEIDSIGIDTWGVDYGLLDKNDNLISNPIHYRDSRTENVMQEVEKAVSLNEIYNITGIQFMPFNTLFQLYSDRKTRSNLLEQADSLLFMPDLFNFYLTGYKRNEYTNASTSQMINANERAWDKDLLNKLGLPLHILQEIILPGQILGYLRKDIQEEVGLGAVPVVAVGSHDTASAVAGTPLDGDNSAYLSCGTWSLLGIECDKPIINKISREYNYTNEGGVENTVRFLKNINGLWLLQQLRKSWCEHVEDVTFPEIINAAVSAKNKKFIVNPNDNKFMSPLNMAEAIKDYCVDSGQGNPEGLGEIAMAAYNGITNEYKVVADNLEKITGRTIDKINMVGGGIQDTLLCRLTAEATGRKITAGPIEASVLGNVLMQLKSLNEIEGLKQGRQIIKSSFKLMEY